jgi:hypothetical protein
MTGKALRIGWGSSVQRAAGKPEFYFLKKVVDFIILSAV